MTPAVIPPDDPGDHGKLDDVIEVDTDDLEACCAATNVLLTQIAASVADLDVNTDGIETTLASILAALTPASDERLIDGDNLSGVDTITIPDGVLSFSVTVGAIGSGITLDGPDFATNVQLFAGQSVSHSADKGNTINGPITVTGTALSTANATWMLP